MPAYIYKCEIHGEFEETHSIKEKLEKCPTCDKSGVNTKVERLIATTTFTLVGSCWAKDRYS